MASRGQCHELQLVDYDSEFHCYVNEEMFSLDHDDSEFSYYVNGELISLDQPQVCIQMIQIDSKS